MKAVALALLAPLAAGGSAARVVDLPSEPKGHLLVVGGGGTTPEMVERALALAGKGKRVVVLPQASAREDAGDGAVSMWKEAGATASSRLDLADPDAARRAVLEADLIWLSGGDQNRLLKALEGTGIPEAIRERYVEGAVVGGTSAGAAVLSELTITGEADLDRLRAGSTGLVPGLGLWKGVIVDQHSLRRGRLNRLITAILDHPDKVGVAIDEQTAVLVSGRRFVVIGRSNVVVLDARKASKGTSAPGEPPAGEGIAMHVLRDGMRFDLDG